eukprot:263369-Pelagomonas_calceolata.AAC.1
MFPCKPFYKVKSHSGIAGDDCADQVANYQASLKDGNLTDTGIPGVGPGGNPFHNTRFTRIRPSVKNCDC